MFPFDPPENIKKHHKIFGFLRISDGSNGKIGKERVKSNFSFSP